MPMKFAKNSKICINSYVLSQLYRCLSLLHANENFEMYITLGMLDMSIKKFLATSVRVSHSMSHSVSFVHNVT